MQTTNRQTGFTLIEIAIVIAIIGIVLGGLFSGMSAMRESSKFKEDQLKLRDIKAALLSYVAVNGHLPCPDTNNNGLENRNGNYCASDNGNLPYNQLNTHAVNAYGLAFSYHVNRAADTANALNADFSASYFGICPTSNDPCFDKDTPPTAAVSDNDNFRIENGSGQTVANQLPLVVISHGQNGCNNVNGFEASNCSTTATTYYQAPQNRAGSDQFDDVLIWLSGLEIKRATPEILPSNSTNTGGGSGNDTTPNWGDYTPTQNLNTTDLLDGAPNYGNLNSEAKQTVTNGNAVFGDINSNAELELVGNTVVSTGNLNSNGKIILTGGNNIIQTNDLNSNGLIYEINGANGNNSIRINGNINSGGTISLNNGNNRVYVGGDVNTGASSISFGSGTNILYVMGNINSNDPIKIDGGTLYINSKIQTGKVTLLNGATLAYCNDPDMNCP